MALPLTVRIDPMSADTRAVVDGLAAEVELPLDRLGVSTSGLTAEERVRVHLARAVATTPSLLLLEQPTAGISDPGARQALAGVLRRLGQRRQVGWIVLGENSAFARAAGGKHVQLNPSTGAVSSGSAWRWFWPRA
jgi:ABC-type multidrug transport system ATPase subunit